MNRLLIIKHRASWDKTDNVYRNWARLYKKWLLHHVNNDYCSITNNAVGGLTHAVFHNISTLGF